MTLVSSKDFVKCRMSGLLLSYLIVDHWPEIRIGLLEVFVPGFVFFPD
jgi:hypothetical protein